MASETFRRLAVAYPDRVFYNGGWAELDGYTIYVYGVTGDYSWTLAYQGKHLISGTSDMAAMGWLEACDALDDQYRIAALKAIGWGEAETVLQAAAAT